MAKKAESTLKNMLLSLTVIALVAAAALAALNGVTKDPIAKAQQAKVENAIKLHKPALALYMPYTFLNIHLSYGIGYFTGIYKLMFHKKFEVKANR